MTREPPPDDSAETRRLDPVERDDTWPGSEDETVHRGSRRGEEETVYREGTRVYREEPPLREETVYTEEREAPPPPPPEPERNWWIWLVALLVLVIAGIAAFLLLSRDGDETELRAVPSVVRLTADDAERALRDEGFEVAREEEANEAEEGVVFEQRPEAGSRVEAGSTVTILVSTGPEQVDVPNVVGLPVDRALERLAESELEATQAEVPSNEPPGTVVAQDPTAGSQVDAGSSVRINVSGGPGTADVPDVVGSDVESATATLGEAGFEANAVEVQSREPAGTVVAQNPAAGTEAREGSTVRLNVSIGETDVPDVVGQDEADARATIEELDLQVNAVQVPSQEPEGTVVAQNPAPGTTVRAGATVRINVSQGPQ